jgi:biopolymer transport protein ExbD
MGGVSIDSGGKGGRRSLDSEINMIPMIDLLMVTISFLLITAVWSHMARLNANAQVPGQTTENPVTTVTPERQLHVEMRTPDKFLLQWKLSGAVVNTIEVPRRDVVSMEGATRVVRFPELADKIASEWSTVGSHRDATDTRFDQAVLHTDGDTPYSAIVGAMDAIYQVHRPLQSGKRVDSVPAFNMTFSVN